jgi:hypothetical protein
MSSTYFSNVSGQKFLLDIRDTSGDPLTGLAYNTAGLTAYYFVMGDSAITPLPLVELTTLDSNSTNGGFIEVDAVNMPGIYRLDLPDAVFASFKPRSVVTLFGAANMQRKTEIIDLLPFNTSLNLEMPAALNTAMNQLDIDGGHNLIEYLIFIWAAVGGKVSGAEGNTLTFRDGLDTYDVFRATVDGNGNRTAIEFYPQ